MVHSLLQLSRRLLCHVWPVGRMIFGSLGASLGMGWNLLVYHSILFVSPFLMEES